VPIYVAAMFMGACLFGYYSLTGRAAPQTVDMVVPHFIVHEMPAGVVGLILAAILAASMSSISGDLNSIATVLTTDYFANFLPRTSDRARLLFGKLAVVVGGTGAALVATLLIPTGQGSSVMERAVTIAAILSGGTLGLFFLGFLTRRATRTGCYAGIAACLIFTGWAVLTEPGTRLIDLGRLNFGLNPILIGVLGHFVLFGVGYAASIVLGGRRPERVEELTFRWKASSKPSAAPVREAVRAASRP
jgi:SSS family solute:Na+ symporter